jgi:hypothetical protein
MMNQKEQGKKVSQVIAKSWADEGFKQKLLDNLGGQQPVASASRGGL